MVEQLLFGKLIRYHYLAKAIFLIRNLANTHLHSRNVQDTSTEKRKIFFINMKKFLQEIDRVQESHYMRWTKFEEAKNYKRETIVQSLLFVLIASQV